MGHGQDARATGETMNVEWAVERLRELRTEYATGESRLREAREEQARLRDSMLRIGGAMQVLEEMIQQSGVFALQAGASNGETAAISK